MGKPDLGHALIINNVASEFPQSERDVEALRAAYQLVGFKVIVFNDRNEQVSLRQMALNIKGWTISLWLLTIEKFYHRILCDFS